MECKNSDKPKQEGCSDPQLEAEQAEKKRELKELDTSVRCTHVEMIPSRYQMDGIAKHRYIFTGFGDLIKYDCCLTKPIHEFLEPTERYTIEEVVKLTAPYLTENREY